MILFEDDDAFIVAHDSFQSISKEYQWDSFISSWKYWK